MQKRAARRGTRALAFLLCLLMVVSLLPVMGASAANEITNQQAITESGLVLDKQLDQLTNGDYKLTLSAYATGTTTTVTEKSGTPLDIVLVLDQSGSMANRLNDLKNAVKQFVKTITDNANEYNVDHRIAVVGFAGADRDNGSSNEYYYANSELFIGSNQYNYKKDGKESTYNQNGNLASDHYNKAFQSVTDSTGAANLTNSIDSLAAKGGTHPDVGFKMANGILNANPVRTYTQADGTTVTCKRIVVMFTDGTPGESGWDADVANDTIKTAYETKNTYGATVYTVGLLDNPSNDVTNFMNYVSSNYPDAQSMSVTTSYAYNPVYSSDLDTSKTYYVYDYNYNNYYEVTYRYNAWYTYWNGPYTPKTSSSDTNRNHTQFYEKTALESTGGPGTQTANKYYMTTSNSSELEQIFDNISQNIQNPSTTVTLDANAVMRDIISDNFELKAGFTAANNIVIKTQSGSTDSNSITWGAETTNPAGITAEVSGSNIDITGFNYSEKYIAPSHNGEKLIVEITGLIPKDSCTDEPTNSELSGIYTAADGTLVVAFPQPTTTVPVYTKVLDFSMTANIAAAVQQTNGELEGTYGTFKANNGDLTYKLDRTVESGNLVFDGVDSVLFYGDYNDDADNQSRWTKVNVIPANNVYYDDDLLTYSSDFKDSDQGYDSAVNSVNYGVDNLSANTTKTLTFTGTGIDVYCTTEENSGSVYAKLRAVDAEGNVINSLVIDAAGNQVMDGSMNNTYVSNPSLINVPTLSFTGLTYGTYQLTIRTGNNENYKLDGVRIYNPANDDAVAVGKESDIDVKAQFVNVRDTLLSATPKELTQGAVYVDENHKTNDISVYEKDGPKNEVYLAQNQKVGFKLTGVPEGATVLVGLSAPENRGNATATVTSGAKATPVSVNSAIDMYYPVTVSSEGYVVIENTSNVLLSVTNVQITGGDGTSSAMLMSSPELMSYMADFDTLEVVQPEPEPTPDPEPAVSNNTVSAIIRAIWAQVMDSIDRLFGR